MHQRVSYPSAEQRYQLQYKSDEKRLPLRSHLPPQSETPREIYGAPYGPYGTPSGPYQYHPQNSFLYNTHDYRYPVEHFGKKILIDDDIKFIIIVVLLLYLIFKK